MTRAMPTDDNGRAMPLVPAKAALAITVNSSLSAQVEVTLNTSTKFIEVNAMNTGLYLKYKTAAGGTAVSASSFDEFIMGGATRHYVIPPSITVVAVIEESASSKMILIEK